MLSWIFLDHLHHISHKPAEVPVIEIRIAKQLGQSWQGGADDEGDGGVGDGDKEYDDEVATVGQLV